MDIWNEVIFQRLERQTRVLRISVLILIKLSSMVNLYVDGGIAIFLPLYFFSAV